MFGPLVRFELRRMSRRHRVHLWRSLYALVLAILVFIAYSAFFPLDEVPLFSTHGNVLPLKQTAAFSTVVFTVFIVWQFISLIAMTPGMTADVVSEEKDRKTIEFLLITDLSNWEILAGKLAARVTYLLTFLLAGVPIFALLPLFGGVDPILMVSCFVAGLITVFGLIGMSAFCSVQARNSRNAVGGAYFLFFGYLMLSGHRALAIDSDLDESG
jgi:ABC-type transport system involved in multi-copper enzyme maturation permease subunit